MRLRFLGLLGFLILWILGVSAVCIKSGLAAESGTEAQGNQGRSKPELQPHQSRYQLQLGDTLEIKFRLTSEFNQTVTIQPDGFINLIDLQDMYVVGKTVPELVEILRAEYSRILNEPIIAVVLKEYEKPYFIVQGEIRLPGKYELRGDITVVEAIGIAGGFNENSKHSQVLLFRTISNNWVSAIEINVKKMISSLDLSEDIHIQPGDMIVVPKNAFSKIMPFIPRASLGLYTYPF